MSPSTKPSLESATRSESSRAASTVPPSVMYRPGAFLVAEVRSFRVLLSTRPNREPASRRPLSLSYPTVGCRVLNEWEPCVSRCRGVSANFGAPQPTTRCSVIPGSIEPPPNSHPGRVCRISLFPIAEGRVLNEWELRDDESWHGAGEVPVVPGIASTSAVRPVDCQLDGCGAGEGAELADEVGLVAVAGHLRDAGRRRAIPRLVQ